MIRFVRSAVVLASLIGMARPGLADPSVSLAQTYTAAAAEPPAPRQQPKAATSTPDTATPANRGNTNDIISVGFGWG